MKFYIILLALSASIFLSEAGEQCKTGEVVQTGPEDLSTRFFGEYSSKKNALLNAVTGNWGYHFKRLKAECMKSLCNCVINKLYPSSKNQISAGTEEAISLGKAGIDFSARRVKSHVPLVDCVVNGEDIYLIEGYKNNGIKCTYDVYVLKRKNNDTEFAGLIRQVEFKTLKSFEEIEDNTSPIGGGSTDPVGNTNPSYGNTNPSYGNTNPSYGNTNPLYGNPNPLDGNTNPSEVAPLNPHQVGVPYTGPWNVENTSPPYVPPYVDSGTPEFPENSYPGSVGNTDPVNTQNAGEGQLDVKSLGSEQSNVENFNRAKLNLRSG